MVTIPVGSLRRDELVPRVQQGASLNTLNIWREVMPAFGVDSRNAHYLNGTVATSNANRILTDRYLHSPGAEVERMTITFGEGTITVAIRKLEAKVPFESQLDYSQILSLEGMAASRLGKIAELTNEYLVANALFSTATFGTAATASGNYISAILSAIAAGTEAFDTIVIGAADWATISQDPDTLAFLVGTGQPGSQVTPTRLASALSEYGITQILVGRATYNSANELATVPVVNTPIWTGYIWVGARGQVIPDEDGGDIIAGAGVSAWWRDYTPEQGWLVDTYEEQKAESTIVRLKTSLTPIVVNAGGGALITVPS